MIPRALSRWTMALLLLTATWFAGCSGDGKKPDAGEGAQPQVDGAADPQPGTGDQTGARASSRTEADSAGLPGIPAAGDQGGATLPPPLALPGRYAMESTLDLTGFLPQEMEAILEMLVAMIDGDNAPTTWIIDQGLAALHNPAVTGMVSVFRPALDKLINDHVFKRNPALHNAVFALIDGLDAVTSRFGIRSTLEIVHSGDTPTATHAFSGLFFDISGKRQAFPLAGMGTGSLKASNVPITLGAETALTIGQHALGLTYGKLLAEVTNRLIIPVIDPTSNDLAGLLKQTIDCQGIAALVAKQFGAIGGVFEGLCTVGLDAAARFFYARLEAIDQKAFALTLEGQGQIADGDGDRKLDRISGGHWIGSVSLGPVDLALDEDACPFQGSREEAP